MNKKKFQFLHHFKFISISLGLLIVTLVVLIYLPNLLNLAQSSLSPAPQVAGVANQVVLVDQHITPPEFSAEGVIALDFDSDQVLYGKNIHTRLYPASTTKIMTALVAVDHYKSADILTVPAEALVGGSSMGLAAGEKLTFRSLLYGMLLNSGNDAAYTIALNYPGGMETFLAAMNQKAWTLNLTDTHFQNPAGFDDPEQYTSAYDLSQIALAAANNPEVSIVVSTKNTLVVSEDNREFMLSNLNELLNIEGVIGFKTGTTPEAGQNFVGLVERKNHKVLTVVLNSQDRFKETKELMDWAYSNFDWTASQR